MHMHGYGSKMILDCIVLADHVAGQWIYENYDHISTYVNDDPIDSVLKNTVMYYQNESQSAVEHSHDDVIVRTQHVVGRDLVLNNSNTYDDGGFNMSYPFTLQSSSLELCPLIPPHLVGPIRVWMDSPPFSALRKLYPFLELGGHGQPKECRSRHRVAVVVPYRDRDSHLRTFLHNIHSFLKKQQIDYAIIIVEQTANQTFNRAKVCNPNILHQSSVTIRMQLQLMNVGYAEGIKLYPWECFIFHDVDLLPEDDRNLYTCPTIPRHMSVAVDKFNYKLPYTAIFGGITAMTVDQLHTINGFSNRYWGWGGEDDDLAERVSAAGYQVARYPARIARYKMIKHVHESKSNPVNKCRYKLMAQTRKLWKVDGLNSLKYELLKLELLPLYTRILVDLLEKNESKRIKEVLKC
ncbi:N-acetyllactosaminide 3-alpha-galactosyltransferase [Dictyocaulus viviparus]|uniref:Beta-1,4-N-acetylgalactosaminyltransferase n=1 Tax=Dictyocaulus viviparus TaxID=29172 RepID=A0A0D8Y1M6_DICVI|nr:N-acetyllactosaminide 3-alpha-galactosyltransferase [Dictyocaulus viviparus]